MRIKRVFVKKLFHLFDHEIPMNMDERITIIHAPNGFGKTAILRMIDGLFNSRYSELRTFPFVTFGVELDDGETLQVERQPADKTDEKRKRRKRNGQQLVFSSGEHRFELKPVTERADLPVPIGAIENIVPHLYQAGPRLWRTADGEVLDMDDVLDRYSKFFPIPVDTMREEPKWLREIRDSVDVRFIRAERLVARSEERKIRHRETGPQLTPTVLNYSEALASAIRATLTKYAELSQSLDRTFPVRLVGQSPAADLTKDEISNRLAEFETKRKRLIDSGLLDQEINPHFQVPQTLDDTKASVLSVYVGDVEEKLAVFDSIALKIDLFKSIINRRFRHKMMAISKENGLTFTTESGQPLDPTSLSSGEQHELIMLYELLFKVRPDSLILVDEPEISLHVAWQQEFLRDLHEITTLSQFDVLVATHSPQIISERWDLTVELEDALELQEAV